MPWKTIWQALTPEEGSGETSTLDRLIRAIRSSLGLGHTAAVDRATFTAAVVALSAKLSKADGVTLQIEEETFERLFAFEPAETDNVRWLFRLAAQDVAGFESYATEVAKALAEEPALKADVFEALMHIATADGVLHESEDHYLASVRTIFGYSELDYGAIRARFVRDIADPYIVLGADRTFSDETLKARYRDLVRENHPDVLAGKGYSRELQDIAQRKLATINAAWDVIAKERGL